MLNFLQKSSQILVYICGALLFISVALISVEVFLRKFFLISLGGVDEISSYILGICISWTLAYVLFEKMHIRIDFIYNKLSQKIKPYLDLLSMAFTLLFISFLSYYALNVLLTSIEKSSTANTPLGTPLWIPQSLWVFGFIFFLIVVAYLFIKGIYSFIKKEPNNDINIESEA